MNTYRELKSLFPSIAENWTADQLSVDEFYSIVKAFSQKDSRTVKRHLSKLWDDYNTYTMRYCDGKCDNNEESGSEEK